MAKHIRNTCRDCGASRDHVHISKAGYCPSCGERRLIEANQQLQQQAGPAYDRWRAGLLTARGPVGRPITPYPPDA